ncbi:MAG TPA: hypothetical protein VFL87_02975 [Thermoleophilaceae bacterium]|nr:hypothetical protein [Thermoleophilaceae bacterium]
MPIRRPYTSSSGAASARSRSHAGFAWRDRGVDAFIDTYVDWREECESVKAAYDRWTRSECSRRTLAYEAYRAALDREEKAADVHRLAAAGLAGRTVEQHR